jgi:omega-6 fatty acid desaturase (delta-12 desaturase)
MKDGLAHADSECKTRVRTDNELISATRPYAVDNMAKSWFCILSTSALWLAAIAGTLWNFNLAAKIVCSIFAGLLLLRLFVIYHDQQHHAILPRSRPAKFFMRVFGIFALSPNSIWQSSHNHHHKHNSKIMGSHIGSFPVMTKAHYLKAPRGTRFKYLFARHPLTIMFGYLFVFLIGMCVRPFLSRPREHLDCLVALLAHIGIGIALVHFFGWQAWLLAQVIPHFITYAIGTYLFYAQHNFPGVSFFDKGGWTYEKAAMESSSYMKTTPRDGLVHRQHRLPSHPPFERADSILPAAGGVAGNAGVAAPQDHLAEPIRDCPVPAAEGLGCGGATDDTASGWQIFSWPPATPQS